MVATALIKFTQTPTVGPDGQMIVGVLSTAVNVANSDNTSVLSWQIDLVYVPPGSGVALATPLAFNNNSTTPAASFTPDVTGCYRLVLKVWSAINRVGTPTDTDIRVFAVREVRTGKIIPPVQIYPKPLSAGAPGDKPNEMNLGGIENGWVGSGSDGLAHDILRNAIVVGQDGKVKIPVSGTNVIVAGSETASTYTAASASWALQLNSDKSQVIYAPRPPVIRTYIYGNVTYAPGPGYRLTDLNFDAPGAGETLTPVGNSPAWGATLNEMKANSTLIIQTATSSISHMTGGGEKNNVLGWIQCDPSGGNIARVLYYVVASEGSGFHIDFLVTIIDPP